MTRFNLSSYLQPYTGFSTIISCILVTTDLIALHESILYVTETKIVPINPGDGVSPVCFGISC